MTLGAFIEFSAKTLSPSQARLETELLAARVLNCSREQVYLLWDKPLADSKKLALTSLLKKRQKGWPMAYLLGEKEFYGEKFKMSPPVFIPRPETETLVSAVLEQKVLNKNKKFIEIGSGCGCVGLSLLKIFSKSQLLAVDKDLRAIQLSELNAKCLNVHHRARFLNKDILKLCKKDLENFKDIYLIIANPPYIAFDDPQVQKEVVQFESSLALFAPNQGLAKIFSWLKKAEELLSPGGYYFFEIGYDQDIFPLKGKIGSMRCVGKFKDFSNTVRVIQFQKMAYGQD